MILDDVIRITRICGICELTSKPKQQIHYSLTIHQMLDLFNLVHEKGRLVGINQERALNALSETSQKIGYDK